MVEGGGGGTGSGVMGEGAKSGRGVNESPEGNRQSIPSEESAAGDTMGVAGLRAWVVTGVSRRARLARATVMALSSAMSSSSATKAM
jgi:hypothetical protein